MAAELRAGAQLAPELFDQLATAVCLIDADGRLLDLNAAAQSLLAIGAVAARGRRLSELLVEGADLERLIQRAIARGEPLVRREWDLHPIVRNDARFVAHCTITPLDAMHGQQRALLEFTDTTQQQRISRDNALLAQQGGSRLMARQLAHEIKNPLGGLRGAAQLLERELPSPELKEYTRVIISEADRLRALVDNLLGPVRPPRREAVNIHEIVDRVYHLVRGEAPATVAIVRDYDPSLPPLPLDRDQVIQAMLNLARNAVQVLDGQGVLTLRTRALTQATIGDRHHRLVAAVQFEDNGPGVPADLRETIFYPLVTGRPGGTGLGLAVAQDLITRHEGLIEFESRPGRTVFTVLLPFAPAGQELP